MTLQDLIALDGFDGPRAIRDSVWTKIVYDFERKMNLNRSQSICEIGCGAGAFLYPLYAKGYRNVVGADFSAGLIETCRGVMPVGHFAVAEARCLPFKADVFDMVICNSVLHYFPDFDYAENSMREFVRILKPGFRGAVLNIPDVRTRNRYETKLIEKLGKPEYDRMYTGNKHLFYRRKWFALLARKWHLGYRITSQSIVGYIGSNLRFNFYFEKMKKAKSQQMKRGSNGD